MLPISPSAPSKSQQQTILEAKGILLITGTLQEAPQGINQIIFNDTYVTLRGQMEQDTITKLLVELNTPSDLRFEKPLSIFTPLWPQTEATTAVLYSSNSTALEYFRMGHWTRYLSWLNLSLSKLRTNFLTHTHEVDDYQFLHKAL